MRILNENARLAGLLVPVFALRHRGDLGIGDTKAVREAVDFCAENKFKVLQMLPIHETIGDHSPYNPISSRALSPGLLWLDPTEVPGLTKEMLKHAAPEEWRVKLREGAVKHNSVHPLKMQILLASYSSFVASEPAESERRKEFEAFKEARADWLPAYTLFRLLVREYEGNPNWMEWRPDHQSLQGAEQWIARSARREELSDMRDAFAFIQWVAWRQWSAVRTYADEKGVLLMGEMSFGVGRTSVDVWAERELFDLEWHVGTRPIGIFDTNKDSERWGQNWGLPAYRWENHRSTGFRWLRGRVASERQFFHICRIDHLRGYFRAYMFPWAGGAKHAEFAQLTEEEARQRTGGKLPRFVPGPDEDPVTARMNDLQGRELIGVLREAAGEMDFVAELMGDMPDYMRRALNELELANLTFPLLERRADRSLPPLETLRKLSLVTYANHDHAPLASAYVHLREQARANPGGPQDTDLQNLLAYVGYTGAAPDTLTDELLTAMVKTLFASPCVLAVLMSSDLLGTPVRFNLPGSYGAGTWAERLEYSLNEYRGQAPFEKRIATAVRFIEESGRAADLGSPALAETANAS